ncbi:MAG: putative transport system permease protein, partial [Pseudonocardiales bacterium]|nr:putative transport system permease protein [Pseudonocardiales bacterium]
GLAARQRAMNAHAFRTTLRMARRDTWRHKWRSLLVVALIGFPVFVLGTADIAWRTWQLDPTERISREIGTADAAARPSCAHAVQEPSAWLGNGFACDSGASPGDTPATLAALLAQLPAGSQAIERLDTAGFEFRTAAGIAVSSLVGFDYANPLARGMVTQASGRAPRTATEIALTSALAKSAGLHVGDQLRQVHPDRTLTVVGIVHDNGYRKAKAAYVLPTAIDRTAAPNDNSTTWLLHTPTPVSWSTVLGLNDRGYVVLSRSVYLNPPPRSAVPFYQNSHNTVPTPVIAAVTLVAGMALLEVVLLAGPAFAVGARRQRRELALIAAVGGETRDLRNVVLANGLVLGVTAGVSAALGAVAAAVIGVPTLGTLVDQVPGHIDIRPWELAGIACVSLLTALLAAIFPALQAARTDVIAALAGRRGTVRTRPHVPVIGAVLAALGVVVAVFGVTAGNGATVILAGVVLTEIGLIVCTPTLLGLSARLGRLLPLAPRIALRDAARNRSAATPAVAAVMASMIGAVAILIVVTSIQNQNKRGYTPGMANHAVFVPTLATTPGTTTASIESVLRATLPVDQVGAPKLLVSGCAQPPPDLRIATRKVAPCASTVVALSGDSRSVDGRYRGGNFPEVVVDDGSSVAALFGRPEPAAVAALRAGLAVVTSDATLTGGKVSLEVTSDTGPVDQPAATTNAQTITLPATVVRDGFPAAAVILPPSAVAGITEPTAFGVIATTTRPPTDRELQVLRGQLLQLDPGLSVDEETGYHNPSTWALYALVGVAALIALGAASIATALANTDGRDDLVTLGAVGASPRTRRLMSMSRAGVIAGLGCTIGVVAGFVPAYAWTRGARAAATGNGLSAGDPGYTALHFVVPWSPILLALLGIPLVSAGLVGLVTRSRLPSEHGRT